MRSALLTADLSRVNGFPVLWDPAASWRCDGPCGLTDECACADDSWALVEDPFVDETPALPAVLPVAA